MGSWRPGHGFHRLRLREVSADAAEWRRPRWPPHLEPRNRRVHDIGPFGPNRSWTNDLHTWTRLRVRHRFRGPPPGRRRHLRRLARRLLLGRRGRHLVLERPEAASDGRIHDAGAEPVVSLLGAA